MAAAVVLLLSVACKAACAEDASAPKPGTLAALLDASGITEAGYVAASYYHSNGYNYDHQFDDKHDAFQLDQVALTIAYQPKEGFGALIDVAAGEDMKVLNAAEGNNPNLFDVVQGFVQYTKGPLTTIAGKYLTLAGADYTAPTGNTNFSRSLLFFAEPMTHTGIRTTYAPSDTLSLIVGINNGWNYSSVSASGGKTAEMGIVWTPMKRLALTAQAYVGKDPIYDAERTLIDTVATYSATDSLAFVLSYDWGTQEQHTAGEPDLDWDGVAAYANYAITLQWRVSLRLEYLDDKNGFVTATGVSQKLEEGTLTFGYDPIKSFELRIEARYDKSDKAPFLRSISYSDGPDTFADDQTEFALEGVYKF